MIAPSASLARKFVAASVLSFVMVFAVGCGPVLGAVAGVILGIDLFTEKNEAPSITLRSSIARDSTSVSSGQVTIPVEVTDANGNTVNVTVNYSTDGVNFSTATVTGNSVGATAGGTSADIIWEYQTDLGDNSYRDTLVLQLIPNDGKVNGSTLTTSTFSAGNDAPVISNVTVSSTVSGTGVISYDVSDTAADTVRLTQFEYSLDSGTTYPGNITTASGDTVSGGSYDSVNDETTVTTAGGNTTLYSFMVNLTMSITGVGDFTIKTFISTTSVVVSGDASAASGATFSVTPQNLETPPVAGTSTTTDFPVGTFENITAATGGTAVVFGWDTTNRYSNTSVNNVKMRLQVTDEFGATSSLVTGGSNDPESGVFSINNNTAGSPTQFQVEVGRPNSSNSVAPGDNLANGSTYIRVRVLDNASVSVPGIKVRVQVTGSGTDRGTVIDQDLSTPPGSPSTGDRYIVAVGGTGDWASQDYNIAEWNGTIWTFTTPSDNDYVEVTDEGIHYVYNSTHDTVKWVGVQGSSLLATDTNGTVDFTDLSLNQGGTYTVEIDCPDVPLASTAETTTGSDATFTFTVTPATTSSFAISSLPSAVTADDSSTIVVTAKDAYDNTVTSYGNTVTFSSSDASAVLPGDTNSFALGVLTLASSVSLRTAGTHFVRVEQSGNSAIAAQQDNISVTAGAFTTLSFTTQPNGTVSTDSTITVVVAVQDSYGNAITTATDITLVGMGGATISGGNPTVSSSGGSSTFSSVAITTTAGSGRFLQAQNSGATITVNSDTFELTPGTATTVTITTASIANVTAGSTLGTVEVEVTDANGNPVTNVVHSVTLTESGGATIASGATANTAASGTATFNAIVIEEAGTGYTFIATISGPISSAAGPSFDVTAGSAALISFSQQPTAITAGNDFSPNVTVTVTDIYSNAVSGATVDLEAIDGGGGALSGDTQENTAATGIATFSNSMTITTSGTSYRLRATTGAIEVTSSTFTVSAGAVTTITFTTQPPSSVDGGSSFDVTVQLTDTNGNLTDNTVDLHLFDNTDTDQGSQGSGLTSSGVRTFTVTVNAADTGYYLQAQITSPALTQNSSTFDVAGVATTVVFTTTPTSGQSIDAGTLISTLSNFVVEVRDANGTPVSASNFSVVLDTSPTGFLKGTTTVTTSSGVATFSNVWIETVGNNYDFTATVVDVGSDSDNTNLDIVPAAPSRMTLTSSTVTNITAGVNITESFQVNVLDAYDNLVTDQDLTITAASSGGGGGALSGTTSSTTGSNGFATFSASTMTIETAGTSYRVVFSQSNLSVNTDTFDVSAEASAAGVSFSVQPNSSYEAGASMSLSVTLVDSFGNTVTTDGITVTMAVTGGAATLNGDTSVNTTSGVSSFTSNVTAAGTYTLTASITSPVSASVESNVFGIAAQTAAANRTLAFSTQPPTTFGSCDTLSLLIIVQDSFGNQCTSGSGTTENITLSIDNSPTWDPGTNPRTPSSGVLVWDGITISTENTFIITATSANGSVGTADTNSFTVVATPTITSITPTIITDGSITVTITGTGFDTGVPGNHSVSFAGSAGTVTAATATALTVTAPATVSAGNLTVTRTDTGCTSDTFTYLLGPTRANLVGGVTQSLTAGSSPVVSDDGRYVVFVSADNLDGQDSSSISNVWRFDVQTQTISRVSESSAGALPDGTCDQPAVSGDGRWVVFRSAATNLTTGDTNAVTDILLRDMDSTTITRVSLTSTDGQASTASSDPDVDDAGDRIVFVNAGDLDGSTPTGNNDIWVRDISDGTTTNLSLDTTSSESDGNSTEPAISGDGTVVVFTSVATDLIASDTNAAPDIFMRTIATNTTTRVSVTDAEAQATPTAVCDQPFVSNDGQYVVWRADISYGTTGGFTANGILWRDTVNGTTRRASYDRNGGATQSSCDGPSVSDDGRYVVFHTLSNDVATATDNNSLIDVMVRDMNISDGSNDSCTRVSVMTDGGQATGGASQNAMISADGNTVVFESAKTNLITSDSNGVTDVYVTTRE